MKTIYFFFTLQILSSFVNKLVLLCNLPIVTPQLSATSAGQGYQIQPSKILHLRFIIASTHPNAAYTKCFLDLLCQHTTYQPINNNNKQQNGQVQHPRSSSCHWRWCIFHLCLCTYRHYRCPLGSFSFSVHVRCCSTRAATPRPINSLG